MHYYMSTVAEHSNDTATSQQLLWRITQHELRPQRPQRHLICAYKLHGHWVKSATRDPHSPGRGPFLVAKYEVVRYLSVSSANRWTLLAGVLARKRAYLCYSVYVHTSHVGLSMVLCIIHIILHEEVRAIRKYRQFLCVTLFVTYRREQCDGCFDVWR